MSGNVTTRLIVAVLAILLSRRGFAQDFTPELVSPLAMEASYDGFVVDNSESTLKTFERLHVTFSGKPANGLDFALFDWMRFEWTLPRPTPGRYLVSLVVHSGDKRSGRFGYVVNGAEYVSEEFRLSEYQWGRRMAAFLVRIPEGQAQTRMFVAGNGLNLRGVPFDAVKVTDAFWGPRIEINRIVSIPHCIKMCEETGLVDNFAKAAGLMKGDAKGIWFSDAQVYKTIEGNNRGQAVIINIFCVYAPARPCCARPQPKE